MATEKASQAARYAVVHLTENDIDVEAINSLDEAIAEASAASDADTQPSWHLRGSNDVARPEVIKTDRVIALPAGQEDASPPQPLLADDNFVGPQKRDWSAALDLVQEACEAIRISEERVAELERENQQAALQAREEAKALQSQLHAAERRAQNAEVRAQKAEARAVEAEGWLARLHDAISVGFARTAASDEM